MIKQRAGGIWWFDGYVGGVRIRKSLFTLSESEAYSKAAILTSDSPSDVTAGSPTLGAAFKYALQSRPKWRDAKSPETIQETYSHVARHFNETRRLSSIGDQAVLDWLDAMRKAKLSASTINQRLSMLSVLFKESQLPLPRIPRMTIRQGRIRTISPEEQAAMVVALRDAGRGHTAALVEFLGDTALRLTEALTLTWKDFDKQSRTVTVWVNKADHPRTVPLTSKAVAIMLSAGAWQPGPFSELTKDSAEHHWQAARESIGLSHDTQFVLHALRHSCISRLAAAGIDAFRIQTFAGHKQIATTQKYVHLNGSHLSGLRDVLEGKTS